MSLTGEMQKVSGSCCSIFPASHYVVPIGEDTESVQMHIEEELEERVALV